MINKKNMQKKRFRNKFRKEEFSEPNILKIMNRTAIAKPGKQKTAKKRENNFFPL